MGCGAITGLMRYPTKLTCCQLIGRKNLQGTPTLLRDNKMAGNFFSSSWLAIFLMLLEVPVYYGKDTTGVLYETTIYIQ